MTTTAHSGPPLLLPLGRGSGKLVSTLLPPAGGGFGSYLGLAATLDRHGPVHGLRAPGLLGAEEPDPTVPAMVRRYHELLTSLPEPPDVLVGWSLGGVLAWEVARRFAVERGRSPAVVLIDSFADLSATSEGEQAGFVERLRRTAGPELGGADLDRFHRTADAHVRAAVQHRASAGFNGPALLLTCSRGPWRRQRADWAARGSRLWTHSLDCDHFDALGSAALPAVAGHINDFLRDVEGELH